MVRHFIRCGRFNHVLLTGAGLGGLLTAQSALAVDRSWNTQDGNWNTAANWTPSGVPGAGDSVMVGNTVAAQNDWVTLNVNSTITALTITDGMMVDMNGFQLTITGATLVSGYNIDGPFGYPSRLRVDQGAAALDCILSSATLSDGGWIELYNGGALRVNHVLTIDAECALSGEGVASFTGNEPVVLKCNGGVGASLEGMTLNQLGAGRFDLDGDVGGDHTLSVTLGTIDGSAQSWLTIVGDELADQMDDDIWVGGGNVLTMDMANGWTMGSGAVLSLFDGSSTDAPAEINGGQLTMNADIEMPGSDAYGQFNVPVLLNPSVDATLGAADRLEFNGNVTLAGGTYTLAQDANIDFDATTTVSGGSFTTFSNSLADGTVDFNGSTSWNGSVTINGAARQMGDATISGPTIIDAGVLDMDGAGPTSWSIGNNLVVNAANIDTQSSSIFDGELNISGTFLGKLTINLDQSNADWTMNGTMNLGGVGAILVTRVEGSDMSVTGDVNVAGSVQVTADTTLEAGSTVTFANASARLRLAGETLVSAAAGFSGDGTLENAPGGDMTLAQGANLMSARLLNGGTLRLGSSPGLVFADRFENSATGTWVVELGGTAPGFEHDQLMIFGPQAILEGTLDVRVIDLGGGLFEPQIGDTFVILEAPAGAVSGSFDNQPVSFVPGQVYLWSVGYGPDSTSIKLTGVEPCPADFNGDGQVDGADLGILLASWGSCRGCIADLDDSGGVDGADLGQFLANWGSCL